MLVRDTLVKGWFGVYNRLYSLAELTWLDLGLDFNRLSRVWASWQNCWSLIAFIPRPLSYLFQKRKNQSLGFNLIIVPKQCIFQSTILILMTQKKRNYQSIIRDNFQHSREYYILRFANHCTTPLQHRAREIHHSISPFIWYMKIKQNFRRIVQVLVIVCWIDKISQTNIRLLKFGLSEKQTKIWIIFLMFCTFT